MKEVRPESPPTTTGGLPVIPLAAGFTTLVLLACVIYALSMLDSPDMGPGPYHGLRTLTSDPAFWSAVTVGFLAQAVDGALGMAYGITATTFLLSSGVSPAVASASVHIAEIFTTGFSGLSHVRFGNINRQLFLRLLLPGILGAVLGAVFITSIDSNILKPAVSAYLLLMGLYILSRPFRTGQHASASKHHHIGKLALFGGFIDSAGGGGWGPVVTTTLLGRGNEPRTTIGSVNFAEFFLALSSATTFIILIGADTLSTVAGLVLGGIMAAPLAAWLCSRLPPRLLLVIVGFLISALSAYNIWRTLIS